MKNFEVGFTMIDNALLRYWMPQLTEAQLKVYLFVASKTDGWNKPSDFISTSQLVEGTGITEGAARKAGRELMEYNLLVRVPGKAALSKEHAKHAQYSLTDPWRALVIAEGGDPDKVLDNPCTEEQLRSLLKKPGGSQKPEGMVSTSQGSGSQEPQQDTSIQNTSIQDTSLNNKEMVAGKGSIEPIPAKKRVLKIDMETGADIWAWE